jgi:hypothetical protein
MKGRMNPAVFWRKLYLRWADRLPWSCRHHLERLPWHLFGWAEKRCWRAAVRSGPPYAPSHRGILIDITTECNLGCQDCSRSCGAEQAPHTWHIDPGQIRELIRESLAAGRFWQEIQIEGGEPTLHPQLEEILGLLRDYRRKHSPHTLLRLVTNGLGPVSRELQRNPPAGIDLYCTSKTSPQQDGHIGFNVAPVDMPEFSGADFSEGCFLPARYGLGLTMGGYYPHPICGGIDRVFGFGIGRKSLPPLNDPMRDQFRQLCPFCGFFRYSRDVRAHPKMLSPNARERDLRGKISPSWAAAYQRFHSSSQYNDGGVITQ